MNAIGSCFVFIITLIGTISAIDISIADKQNFFFAMVQKHNQYRKRHGLKPLISDDKANIEAQRLMEKFANEHILEASMNYGVNEGIIDLSDITKLDHEVAENLVAEWYRKFNEYNHNIQPTDGDADAFTQIVWKKTEKLGLAMKENNNLLYVIATYFPKGNKIGEYTNNVPKLQNDSDEKKKINKYNGNFKFRF